MTISAFADADDNWAWEEIILTESWMYRFEVLAGSKYFIADLCSLAVHLRGRDAGRNGKLRNKILQND